MLRLKCVGVLNSPSGKGERVSGEPRQTDVPAERQLTRRSLLARGAALGLSATLPAATADGALARARRRHKHRRRHRPIRSHAPTGPIPLPTPAQVQSDFERMVAFGPRLTASPEHANYIAWLEQEFTAAGLDLLAPDQYHTQRWLAQEYGLEILAGGGAGPVKVACYYPRCTATAPQGVTGPLVYGGSAPAPSVSFTDLGALQAAAARYPADIASWASGLSGTLAGGAQGSILLVDLPVPPPATGAAFLPIATYLNWPGHSIADWAASDYKRLWIEPGLSIPLAPFQALGASAVVFIVDASYEALKGGYLPFTHGFEPLPALYVDRDTGRELRQRAAARPKSRLTLTATLDKQAPTHALTAVLRGKSDEVIIFNTHTDGQGFVEENGGVAFVHLARYFATLPAARRLNRTLVFAAWPGHMVADLPQTQGWIDAHPDLIKRAACALTVEHLGCTEWTDTVEHGYRPTGLPEMFAVWTTQGKMFEVTRDTVIAHGLPRTALLRPPAQFGVGGAFQTSGVPQIGAIAGPEYLLTISPNGDLDKLDPELAARQIAWLADLATKLDPIPAAQLRQGDPTLG